MKKLIAISVVFALVAGAAFAVDVTGTVNGSANVIQGQTQGDGSDSAKTVKATGKMVMVRIDGAGENDDGTFGGYVRIHRDGGDGAMPSQTEGINFDAAYAWWKPVDQFKLIIGRQSDAFWGKEGVTGWMFNQKANDAFATNPGIWYGNWWSSAPYVGPSGGAFYCNRYTFYEGWADWGAGVEITPADMIAINIAIPYHVGPGIDSVKADETPSDAKFVYRAVQAQVDLKFDFGNFALSYDGGYRNATAVGSAGGLYLYAGLNVIENLGIDIGLSYHLKGDKNYSSSGITQTEENLPVGMGVGLKFTADSFGIKFRTTVALAGDKKGPAQDFIYINSSVLPYFNISDNMAAFVNFGLGVLMGDGDRVKIETGNSGTNVGWYFNPYLRVGAEWGPSFYAGIEVKSDGTKRYGKESDSTNIVWSVPVALVVSF